MNYTLISTDSMFVPKSLNFNEICFNPNKIQLFKSVNSLFLQPGKSQHKCHTFYQEKQFRTQDIIYIQY